MSYEVLLRQSFGNNDKYWELHFTCEYSKTDNQFQKYTYIYIYLITVFMHIFFRLFETMLMDCKYEISVSRYEYNVRWYFFVILNIRKYHALPETEIMLHFVIRKKLDKKN